MAGGSVPYALCSSHSQREDLFALQIRPPSTLLQALGLPPGKWNRDKHTANALYHLAVLLKDSHVM